MVAFVNLQVLGEMANTIRKERNLDLRRTCVGLVAPILGDDRSGIGRHFRKTR